MLPSTSTRGFDQSRNSCAFTPQPFLTQKRGVEAFMLISSRLPLRRSMYCCGSLLTAIMPKPHGVPASG